MFHDSSDILKHPGLKKANECDISHVLTPNCRRPCHEEVVRSFHARHSAGLRHRWLWPEDDSRAGQGRRSAGHEDLQGRQSRRSHGLQPRLLHRLPQRHHRTGQHQDQSPTSRQRPRTRHLHVP